MAENVGDLTDILLYHVVSGKVMAADVVGLTSAPTVLGKDVNIKVMDAYVRDDLQYSGNSELLAELTATATDAGRLRVYAGYSGWAPSRLEGEIARGAWLPTPLDPSILFEVEAEQRWEAAYALLGLTPTHLMTMRTVGSA